MEFVALGVLGVFGYLGSQQKKQSPAIMISPPPQPAVRITDLEQQFKNDVAAHLRNDDVVLPYFRSEKSQNTNESLKDRRLQTFTGSDNLDHMSKKEVAAPAPVRDLTNMYGCVFNPNMDVYKNSLSGRQHNVSPVEPQHIGPGLGAGSDPGFHEFFRIMPDNVNGYRKNTFAGEVIPGHSIVTNGTLESFQNTRDMNLSDAELARLGERNMDLRAPATVTAPRQNAPVILKETQGEMGYTQSSGFANAGVYVNGASTRAHDRTTDGLVSSGAFANRNAGYQNARYFHNDTDRETTNPHRTNPGGNEFGTYATSAAVDSHTQRGQANARPPHGGTGGAHGPTIRPMNDARPTHRETQKTAYAGGAFANAGHTVPDAQLDRSTFRGQANRVQENVGRGSYIHGATDYSNTRVDAYQKAIVAGYEPNIQKTTNWMNYDLNLTRGGSDNNPNRICSNPQGFVSGPTPSESLGNVYFNDKTPVENHRDFGYTPPNPLVTTILSK
jgi:hypothetical protein